MTIFKLVDRNTGEESVEYSPDMIFQRPCASCIHLKVLVTSLWLRDKTSLSWGRGWAGQGMRFGCDAYVWCFLSRYMGRRWGRYARVGFCVQSEPDKPRRLAACTSWGDTCYSAYRALTPSCVAVSRLDCFRFGSTPPPACSQPFLPRLADPLLYIVPASCLAFPRHAFSAGTS